MRTLDILLDINLKYASEDFGTDFQSESFVGAITGCSLAAHNAMSSFQGITHRNYDAMTR